MTRTQKWIGALTVLAGVIILVALRHRAPPPGPPLPNPNGYDDFVQASRALVVGTVDLGRMSRAELELALTNNTEALRLVRLGLSRECLVPLGATNGSLEQHINELGPMKSLAHLLVADGKLALLEQRTNDALQAYADVIRFGSEMSRGGLIIDRLVGVACEALADRNLPPAVDSLDAAQCRRLIGVLESLDARGEPPEELFRRDEFYGRLSLSSFSQRVAYSVGSLVSSAPMRAVQQQVRGKLAASDTARRRLLLQLAGRVYELDHGKKAERAEEMVPGYLKAIPIDPATGTNFVFVP